MTQSRGGRRRAAAGTSDARTRVKALEREVRRLKWANEIHHGGAPAIREARGRVLEAAYLATPQRFVRKPPEPPKLPETVWINKPEDKEAPAH